MTEAPSRAEAETLFRHARATIARALAGEGETRGSGEAGAPPHGGLFDARMGAFVSLHGPRGRLRGCIGRIVTDRPLGETIGAMARSAAFEDPRFPPLASREYGDIDLEITLLSPLRKIAEVGEIEVGRHGVYLVKGWRSAVFLPQVAPEQGWDRTTLLEELCRKAGLADDAWRAPEAELFTFEGRVLKEEDYLPRTGRVPASGSP